MKEVFEDMMDNILEDGFNDKGHCSEAGQEWEKELCKLLLRIFLWIDGFEQHVEPGEPGSLKYTTWKKRDDSGVTPEQRDLQPYYRCLLGNVTIIKMLGRHCSFNTVAPVIGSKRESVRQSFGDMSDGNEICKDVDVGSLNLGGMFMWGEIKKWIDVYGSTGNDGKRMLSTEIKGHNKLHRIKNEGQAEKYCHGRKKEKEIKKETLQKLNIKADNDVELSLEEEKEPSVGRKALDELVRQVKEVLRTAGLARKEDLDEEELMQKLKEVVNEAIYKVLPPQQQQQQVQGNECKGALCDRLSCIAHKWKNIRGHGTSVRMNIFYYN
ncbi:SICA-like antigen [Plasmodium coatneyi]|uniref:SICA-like antigen n=1 Tax=Plasmodium coatneyi TaxID=208452 RepID=A0A1B1DTF1_9APIC|nr:SICA-like antigen [Plasmodium coatneyi]ANQ06014.1 SICA-like antigen [Plasmodium coatneyi]